MSAARGFAKVAEQALSRLLPLTERAAGAARQAFDEVSEKAWGDDFADRVQALKDRYEALGDDPFGMDPDVAKYGAMVTAFLHRLYFRSEVIGIENVPEGRALLVSNHSGQIPLDGAMICTSMFMDAKPPRLVRAMVEKWVPNLPFVSTFFFRVGQVVGVPSNCRTLLERGELVLVFPEGVRGISKPFTRRYQMEKFGHGFMRLALESKAPIVPVSVIGAEEQYISLGNMERVAHSLGLPVLPMIPQLLLGGVLPLPTKYHIRFGEPMRFDTTLSDAGALDDDRAIEEKVWLVKQAIQAMLDDGLKQRKGIFR
jgi:1-acyl-sn-glycerol-3-phosphate acyltransferase